MKNLSLIIFAIVTAIAGFFYTTWFYANCNGIVVKGIFGFRCLPIAFIEVKYGDEIKAGETLYVDLENKNMYILK